MPYSGTGSYAVTNAGGGRVNVSTGIDQDGSLLFTGGTYAIGAYLAVGANLSNALPVRGVLQITSDAEISFAPPVGEAATVQVGTNLNSSYSGTAAYGYLDILSGGRLSVTYRAPAAGDGSNAYANLIVGGTAGALGQITVDGVGSQLLAAGDAGRIALGFNGGLGALVTVAGGYAGTLSLQAGGNGGLGQVYISGAGSEVTVSSANGAYIDQAYAGQSGSATFGLTGGRGLLGIVAGGVMTVENTDGETDQAMARFGRENGSYGYGLVRGVGSELRVTQHGAAGDDFGGGATLSVGEGGQGVFLVEETGSIAITGDAARLNIAAGRYSAGQPDVTAEESRLTIATGGVVTVDSGSYQGAAVVIGGGRETNGRLVVEGSGSRLSVTGAADIPNDSATGQIVIGNLGVGLLEIREEALVEARNIELGRSLVDQGGVLAAGDGTLDIASGGRVLVAATANNAYLGLQVGEGAGSNGTVIVTGTGSELTSEGGAGRIRLGYAGTGMLEVAAGATASGFFLEAGHQSGGRGTVLVRGTGSQLSLSDANGSFSENGGQSALLRLGREAGSRGDLRVFNGAEVAISNAGSDRDQPAIVAGTDLGSTGGIVVSGSGAEINLTLTGASNDAYAPGNGLYYGPRLRLGQLGGAGDVDVVQNGRINLTGENAELWVGEGATDGQADQSILNINSGGSVNVSSTGASPAAVTVGRGEDSHGRLVVFGAGSALDVTSNNQSGLGANVTVGALGYGDLFVRSGAQLAINGGNDAFPSLTIGRGADDGTVAAKGTVWVEGAGATLTISGTKTGGTADAVFGAGGLITVGLREGATGTLEIENGGLVQNSAQNSATIVAMGAGSTGEVVLSGQGSRLEAGVLLTIGSDVNFAAFGDGDLPMILPGSGGNGLLQLGAGTEVFAETIVLGDSGVLAGEGRLIGDLTAHGRLTPGGDGETGTLDHVGAFSLEAGAVLALDIDAFAPGQADLIRTSGDIDVDFGSIAFEIALAPGLTSSPGQATIIESDRALAPLDMLITALDGTRLRLSAVDGVGIVLEIRDLILTGTAGADTLRGAAGDDTLFASAGADLLDGSGGADTVDYGASASAVEINLNTGTASGGLAAGDTLVNVETLIGSASDDRLVGDSKINRLEGGVGDDFLNGGAANDSLFGGGGIDELIGGLGNDVLDGGSNGDTLNGGRGADQLFGGLGADRLAGGLNADSLFGGDAADTLNGGAANDFLQGDAGNDRIDTGAGSDTAFGGAGNDTLTGRGGGDVLDGGVGEDRLFGGAGFDTLTGGAGADRLDGGAGNDAASYADAAARVIADLAGIELQEGDALGDQFIGVETLIGSAHSDFLYGDAATNLLVGGAASDNLFGRGGDDTLLGGDGVDLLRGQGGVDLLTGGAGNDRFFFLDLSDSGVGAGSRDVITDFESGEVISLSAIDADLTQSGNDVFTFIGMDAFSGSGGELRFAKSATNNLTLVHADVDGDAVADLQIELTGLIDLAMGDFIL